MENDDILSDDFHLKIFFGFSTYVDSKKSPVYPG